MPGGNPAATLHIAKKRHSRIQRVVTASLAVMAIGFGGAIGAEATGHQQLSHDLFDGGLGVLVADLPLSAVRDFNRYKVQRLELEVRQNAISG